MSRITQGTEKTCARAQSLDVSPSRCQTSDMFNLMFAIFETLIALVLLCLSARALTSKPRDWSYGLFQLFMGGWIALFSFEMWRIVS